MLFATAPLGGVGNDACARGGDTKRRASRQSWQTQLHGDRSLPGHGWRRRHPSCLMRKSRRVAACQPGRAAGAAGTDSAARRDTRGVRATGADPRCSCAADGGPVGGRPEHRRLDAACCCRAGDRCAHDYSDRIPQRTVLRSLQMAEQLVEVPPISPSSCVLHVPEPQVGNQLVEVPAVVSPVAVPAAFCRAERRHSSSW